jgi:hypothetical protein
MSRDVSASLAAGLRTRDVAETARETSAWLKTSDPSSDQTSGLTAAREAELLRIWRLG